MRRDRKANCQRVDPGYGTNIVCANAQKNTDSGTVGTICDKGVRGRWSIAGGGCKIEGAAAIRVR